MKILAQQGDLAQWEADAIIVTIVEGTKPLTGAALSVDKALKGMISQELQAAHPRFKGKLADTLVLPTYGKLPAAYVILVGLGKPEEIKGQSLRRASAAAIRAAKKLKVKSVATALAELNQKAIKPFDTDTIGRLLAEGAVLGSYQFTLRKGKKAKADNGTGDSSTPLSSLTVVLPSTTEKGKAKEKDTGKGQLAALKKAVRVGQVIAESVNTARDWVNDSANYVTPTFLKEQAEAIPGLTCKVLTQAQIKKLGMGSFALVAQGSEQPAFLIHLSYKPKGKAQKKVALIGKGITFDSGGLSLKPAGSMETMKMDMGGAAAVLATMKAIAELQDLSVQVDCFVPTCENMPSGRSSKPGDIVTAMNGKTIEVNNTDAEGRLILCDAMTYAQKEVNPDEMIDLATLTGACVVALGKAAAGIMGTSDDLIDRVRKAGEAGGEKLWPLPLYDEYKSYLKSDVADLINAGAKGEAGSSAAGMFLKEFVDKNLAWAHLDIAGPAWVSSDSPEIPKGGTGFGVRTLLYYLYQLQE